MRVVDYLRISVTDRCNLRCTYCMPEKGVNKRSHAEMLSFEEITRIAEIAVSQGVRRIRLTGGEPLVRGGITQLVQRIAGIPEVRDLSLTTNGQRLPEIAADLCRAGLNRVNISLDSLQTERYARLTRGGDLPRTLLGIEEALRVGLLPVKINTVIIRDLNDQEVPAFLDFVRQFPIQLRFIEYMPIGENWSSAQLLESAQIRSRIEDAVGPLSGALTVEGGGPAEMFTFAGALGQIGFISAMSAPFCASCNRMRLTADGRLRGCLFSDQEIDLRDRLRSGATNQELIALWQQVLSAKPLSHQIAGEPNHHLHRIMSEIGG